MAKELSKDDLLKLLGANLKKPRKKRDISEEQREELIARLAKMREKAKEVRVEKSKLKKEVVERDEPEPARKATFLTVKPQIDDELFEKKFINRFDKMDDIMSRLDIRMAEMTEAKKAKREAKALEASKAKQEPEPQDLENPTRKHPLTIKGVRGAEALVEQVKQEVKETYKQYNVIPKLPDYRNMIRKKY
jgi:hypothetical protein